MLCFLKSIFNYCCCFFKTKIEKSIIFNPYNENGDDFILSDDLRNNKVPFFRKMSPPENHSNVENIELSNNEKKIIEILINNPHPNIVKYYRIHDKFIDMELLDLKKDFKKHKKEIIKIMENVKQHLQQFGIIYIDWKFDNIGYSKKNRTYKLFDFDVSGLINIKTNEWIIKPPEYWNYNYAIKNYKSDPEEIDDFCFNYWVNS